MISYPHFAVSNLYLLNGYRLEETPHGEVYEYECEDALEECVRRVLMLIPRRLTGPQVRFLRRGLGMTQEVFGRHLDRDSQTIARMEKDSSHVPVYVDLTTRALVIKQNAPTTPVGDLVSTVYGLEFTTPHRVLLSYLGNGLWVHAFEGASMHAATSGPTVDLDLPVSDLDLGLPLTVGLNFVLPAESRIVCGQEFMSRSLDLQRSSFDSPPETIFSINTISGIASTNTTTVRCIDTEFEVENWSRLSAESFDISSKASNYASRQ